MNKKYYSFYGDGWQRKKTIVVEEIKNGRLLQRVKHTRNYRIKYLEPFNTLDEAKNHARELKNKWKCNRVNVRCMTELVATVNGGCNV